MRVYGWRVDLRKRQIVMNTGDEFPCEFLDAELRPTSDPEVADMAYTQVVVVNGVLGRITVWVSAIDRMRYRGSNMGDET